jgi:hypothetical protein
LRQDCSATGGSIIAATHILVSLVQCHPIQVFRICVRYATLFGLLPLTIHLFKDALAGQFRFPAALTKPNAGMPSE